MAALHRARQLIDALPAEDVGCAYLDPVTRAPVTPEADPARYRDLHRHQGSVSGAWPVIRG